MYTWFQAMHTRVDILMQLSGSDARQRMEQATEAMRSTIVALERTANCFAPESELSAFNRLPAGTRMELSPELHHILTLCQRYHALTEGLFDITVHSPNHTPSTFGQLHIAPDHTAMRGTPDLYINLSGFLKGYALDRLATLLDEYGIHHALVNMGNSSIMARGDVPFHIRNACLTTSGNSPANPRHILHPVTGQYITEPVSISVVTANGSDGEVASTAMFLATPSERMNLLTTLGIRNFTINPAT